MTTTNFFDHQTKIFVIYIFSFILFLIALLLFIFPGSDRHVFVPFVACFGALLGFFSAELHLYYASIFSKFRWYRKMLGGLWYKYEFTGALPGLYGTMWTKEKLPPHRYYKFIRIEHHNDFINGRQKNKKRNSIKESRIIF